MSFPLRTEDDCLHIGIDLFKKMFPNKLPTHAACAPATIIISGDAQGFTKSQVLTMAVPLVMMIIGRKSDTNACTVKKCPLFKSHVSSVTFEIPSDRNLIKSSDPYWFNCIKGVISKFIGPIISFDAIIVTTIPLRGGLSNNAALVVAIYTFLEALSGIYTENPIDKAIACQRALIEFLNFQIEIIDQLASIMSKKNNLLLIDCSKFSSSMPDMHYISIYNRSTCVILINPKIKRKFHLNELIKWKEICKNVANVLGLNSLNKATLKDIDKCLKKNLISEMEYKGAKHVITEIIRTSTIVKAFQKQDYKTVGHLMYQSYCSFRDNFETSFDEVDFLVEIANNSEGCYGARMTGTDLGRCVVCLVKMTAIEMTIAEIVDEYMDKIENRPLPEFFFATPSGGAKVADLTRISHIDGMNMSNQTPEDSTDSD